MADSGKTVFMFPGQGSQSVGMRDRLGELKDEEKAIFETADRVLGFSLTGIIDNGPEEELIKTSNTQPALLAMGMAFAVAIEQKGYAADMVMGHSLGEYSALVHAGVLSYEEALRLVRNRGKLMEEAVHDTPGRMAAVIGAERSRLEEIVKECRSAGVLEITNFNSPVQVVLSGEVSAVAMAVSIINESGTARAMELNVSAPFHSSLMKPVAEKFKEYIKDIAFVRPAKLFIDNVTGLPESDPEKIREKLVKQLSSPVQWERSVLTACENGAGCFIESGPGTVLAGLVKRISRTVTILNGEKIVH